MSILQTLGIWNLTKKKNESEGDLVMGSGSWHAWGDLAQTGAVYSAAE